MKTLWLLVLLIFGLSSCTTVDWQTASRESMGISPKPEELTESIYEIYTARAFSWRGIFATHPWIAWKRKSEAEYSVAQVTGWGVRHGTGGTSVNVQKGIPDRRWFGNEPTLIFEARGENADRMIDQITKLIEDYPYKDSYTLWPGPNSNTFVEYIIRYTPEITVELPPHSIGKDYLTNGNVFALSPSGTGVQFSLFGLFGFTLGAAEGIELNILSMTFGIDFLRPALKLPFIGRVGMDDKPL
jgi:hypothetical protein